MAVKRFPDPRLATPEGIVAVGGDLEPETLWLAYSQGIFPWPIEGMPLTWFCPARRAILEFDRIHVPRTLAKVQRRKPFRFTMNEAFDAVISGCAETPRPGQPGTWITPELRLAYAEFHRRGFAHSVEAWTLSESEPVLAGGIYGVEVNGVFSAESMFYREPNASKLALLQLVELLTARGMRWIDIQVMTPHMKTFGARNVARATFLKMLSKESA